MKKQNRDAALAKRVGFSISPDFADLETANDR